MSRRRRGASALGLLATLILLSAVALAAYGMYKPSGPADSTAGTTGTSSGTGPVAVARSVALASAASAIASTANANAMFNANGRVDDAGLNAAASEVLEGTDLAWAPASMGVGYLSDANSTVSIAVQDGKAVVGQ